MSSSKRPFLPRQERPFFCLHPLSLFELAAFKALNVAGAVIDAPPQPDRFEIPFLFPSPECGITDVKAFGYGFTREKAGLLFLPPPGFELCYRSLDGLADQVVEFLTGKDEGGLHNRQRIVSANMVTSAGYQRIDINILCIIAGQSRWSDRIVIWENGANYEEVVFDVCRFQGTPF